MQEHEVSDPLADSDPRADSVPPADTVPSAAGEETLAEFETDLDDVAGALDALDADDLATAETLVAGLGPVESDRVGTDAAADAASDTA